MPFIVAIRFLMRNQAQVQLYCGAGPFLEPSVVILTVNSFVREADGVEELLLTLVDEALRREGDIGLGIPIENKGLKNLRI